MQHSAFPKARSQTEKQTSNATTNDVTRKEVLNTSPKNDEIAIFAP